MKLLFAFALLMTLVVLAPVNLAIGQPVFMFSNGATSRPAPTVLPIGTYNITNSTNSVDASFSSGTPPYVRLNATDTTSSCATTLSVGSCMQQWAWNGTTFNNIGLNNTPGNATGPFLADNNDGTVTATKSGDTWTPMAVTGGISVKNNRTGNFLNICSGALCMGAGPISQTIASVTAYTAANTFAANTSNAPLNPTIAVTMAPPSPAFAGTLALSGIAGGSAVIWGYINPTATTATPGAGFTGRNPQVTEDLLQTTAASIPVTWTVSNDGTSGSMLAAASLVAPSVSYVKTISTYHFGTGTSVTTSAFPAIGVGNTLIGVISSTENTLTNVTDNVGNVYNFSAPVQFNSFVNYQYIIWLTGIKGAPTTLTFTYSTSSTGNNFNADEYAGVTAIDSSAIQYTASNATAQSITLNRSNGNSCGFHLTSASLPSTVQANGSGGCATTGGPHSNGIYDDWQITASQTGMASVVQKESAAATGQTPVITVNGVGNAVVVVGATMSVKVANGPGGATNILQLDSAGAPDNDPNRISWLYLQNCSQTPPTVGVVTGTCQMTAPSNPGNYEARFYTSP